LPVLILPLDEALVWYYAETLLPRTKETAAKTKNTKNKTLAISMAEPAMLVNPSTAAMIATTKNVKAQFNICYSFLEDHWTARMAGLISPPE